MEQINKSTLEQKRKQLLDKFRQKQPLRVTVGKSRWIEYNPETFKPSYNMREILKDEIVIEFDMPNDWKGTLEEFQEISWKAINQTAINLYEGGLSFEIWDHKGKSPHLHIHNLPITHLEKEKRKLFKQIFSKRYVPGEYHKYLDSSLCGIHLVALEYQNHWKKKYSTKNLIWRFNQE